MNQLGQQHASLHGVHQQVHGLRGGEGAGIPEIEDGTLGIQS